MKGGYLWLTFRLMRKQRARTMAIFFGILFSCILLNGFGGLGYRFWQQVHSGTDDAVYDSTQWVLLTLVLLLAGIVLACAVILLQNLMALTFSQKWQSLRRLVSLGAAPGALVGMIAAEIGILYGLAMPLGILAVSLAGNYLLGIHALPPWPWLLCVSALLLLTAQLCGLHPAWRAVHRRLATHRHKSGGTRVVVCLVLAIILYVPAAYLIQTNLQMNQSELNKRYGIEYGAALETYEDFTSAMEELDRLHTAAQNSDSMIYVKVPASVHIPAPSLSRPLIRVLKQAGWTGGKTWTTQGAVIFLDDHSYEVYLNGSSEGSIQVHAGKRQPSILVNRVVNRTGYSSDHTGPYPETPLLEPSSDHAKLYLIVTAGEPDRDLGITADLIYTDPPADFEFDGDVTFILPLSRFPDMYGELTGLCGVWVSGFFTDNETLCGHMQTILGDQAIGQLRDNRRAAREWYDSLSGIHRILTAICIVLLLIALLNVLGTLLFWYLECRHGLAIRWSVGTTKRQLLWMLMWKCGRCLLCASAVGIPTSVILCYAVYKVYQRVWQTEFVLPCAQLGMILGAAVLMAAIAFLVQSRLIQRQDFLQEIKRVL